MKKMKKYMLLLLALLMLLTACGKEENDPGETPPETPPVTEQKNELTKPKDPLNPDKTVTDTEEDPEETTEPEQKPDVQQPAAEDPGLTQLRKEIAGEGKLFGVAYLGYADLPYWSDVCVYVEANGFADRFPFLNAVDLDHAALQEGGEVYAVIPVDDTVRLTVADYVMDMTDDYIPDRGVDLVVSRDGQPLLLRGNVSEIVPNLLIIAEKDGRTVEYAPCISGMDGMLVWDENIHDFTPYDMIMGGGSEADMGDHSLTFNYWYSRYTDMNGNEMALFLSLNADGTAEYSYGWPYSGVVERFEGTWQTEGNQKIELLLKGGPVDDLGTPIEGEQYQGDFCFRWELDGSNLILYHDHGYSLMAGKDGAVFTFMSFDGWHMVDTWRTEDTYWNWYYDLQLRGSEECTLTIGDIGGDELARYDGWWYIDGDGMLAINMIHTSGTHPENPEVDQITGIYAIEDWSPYGMTLRHVSGAILNPEMEETTCAAFKVR